MPGLYIIESFEKTVPSIYEGLSCLSFVLGIIMTFIFWGPAIEEGTYSILGKFYWTLTFLSIIIGSIFSLHWLNKVPSYPAYKAIITSEIDIEKFNEKYEIINKKNDIYTIKEK